MVFDELQNRFGPYVAELVRQALTLEEFAELEMEELVSYFELRAEKVYQEYRVRLESPLPDDHPGESKEEYLNTLRRRWQQAEELAHLVLTAEASANEGERVTASRA
jgi:hypothetical protein